jgi:hypothetical protein
MVAYRFSNLELEKPSLFFRKNYAKPRLPSYYLHWRWDLMIFSRNLGMTYHLMNLVSSYPNDKIVDWYMRQKLRLCFSSPNSLQRISKCFGKTMSWNAPSKSRHDSRNRSLSGWNAPSILYGFAARSGRTIRFPRYPLFTLIFLVRW